DAPAPPPPEAKFFPRFQEPDGSVVDPLETPRADWLGVRTRERAAEGAAPPSRDGTMEVATAPDPPPARLPPVLRTPVPSEPPAEGMGRGPVASVAEVEPLPAATAPERGASGAPVTAGREAVIGLEYVDGPTPTEALRRADAGRVQAAQRSPRGPARYGPEP